MRSAGTRQTALSRLNSDQTAFLFAGQAANGCPSRLRRADRSRDVEPSPIFDAALQQHGRSSLPLVNVDRRCSVIAGVGMSRAAALTVQTEASGGIASCIAGDPHIAVRPAPLNLLSLVLHDDCFGWFRRHGGPNWLKKALWVRRSMGMLLAWPLLIRSPLRTNSRICWCRSATSLASRSQATSYG